LKAKKPESASANSGFFLRGSSVGQTPLGKLTARATHPYPCRDKTSARRRCGDGAVSDLAARRSESNAGVRPGDGSPMDAAAFGSAAQAAAARCEEVRRNYCNDPVARFRCAASGRAPDNPDSNTAPSNRADIAFVCLAKPTALAAEGERLPPKRPDLQRRQSWRDCALGALVSQGESIQLVVVLLQTCGKRFRRTLAIRLRMF
jgi:hypothetical protein